MSTLAGGESQDAPTCAYSPFDPPPVVFAIESRLGNGTWDSGNFGSSDTKILWGDAFEASIPYERQFSDNDGTGIFIASTDISSGNNVLTIHYENSLNMTTSASLAIVETWLVSQVRAYVLHSESSSVFVERMFSGENTTTGGDTDRVPRVSFSWSRQWEPNYSNGFRYEGERDVLDGFVFGPAPGARAQVSFAEFPGVVYDRVFRETLRFGAKVGTSLVRRPPSVDIACGTSLTMSLEVVKANGEIALCCPTGLESSKWLDTGASECSLDSFRDNNCYSYAINSFQHNRQQGFKQVGGGVPISECNCDVISQLVELDGLVAGRYCTEHTCPVALWVRPGPCAVKGDPGDFHFTRKNLDGTWTHKPGDSMPSVLKAARDPEPGDVLGRYQFCGSYCAPCVRDVVSSQGDARELGSTVRSDGVVISASVYSGRPAPEFAPGKEALADIRSAVAMLVPVEGNLEEMLRKPLGIGYSGFFISGLSVLEGGELVHVGDGFAIEKTPIGFAVLKDEEYLLEDMLKGLAIRGGVQPLLLASTSGFDLLDFARFERCRGVEGITAVTSCLQFDFDLDKDVSLVDFKVLHAGMLLGVEPRSD